MIFFFVSNISAAQNTFNYEIKGNKKTSTRFIKKLCVDCNLQQTKEHPDKFEIVELEQCLINSRLFSSVKATKKDEQNIAIEVAERWSIIPIPFIVIKDDGTISATVFIMDANFFGTGTFFGLGAFYSDNRSGYMLFYKDRSFLFTNWTTGLAFGKSNEDTYLKTKKLDTIDAYSGRTYYESASVGYKFNNELNVTTSLSHKDFSYKTLGNYTPPNDYRTFSIGLESQWSKEKYKFYFLEGVRIQGGIDTEISRSDNSTKAALLGLTITSGKELLYKHALQGTLNSSLVLGGDKRNSLKPGSRRTNGRGFRGVPEGGFYSKFISTLSFDYQIPVYFAKHGTWTVAPFWDTGFINKYNQSKDSIFQNSYGVGSYFYLSKVMLPGLGFTVGRNEPFNDFFVEISVGTTM